MGEFLMQWLIIALAIAIGWVLGFFSKRRTSSQVAINKTALEERMQLLYSSYSSESLESLVSNLPVSKDTLALHISIAGHFRKKGEVDRSLLIHQNLLAYPGLPEKSIEDITYELAKDYMSAGLFDRAEALLLKLQTSRHFSTKALRKLLDIYTQEQEWLKAVEVAQKLVQFKEPMSGELTHFYCELASDSLRSGDLFEAEQFYRRALDCDKKAVRPYIAYADFLIKRGSHKEAVSYLRKAAEQNSDFLCELIPRFLVCAEALKEETRFRRYLDELQVDSSPSLALGMAESLRQELGAEEAEKYLSRALLERPKLITLDRLLDLRMDLAEANTDVAFLAAVKQVTTGLLKEAPRYRCMGCGFAGKQLYWLCPSCKQWGKIRPVQGVSGL